MRISRLLFGSLFVAVVLPWPSNHPWSQAIVNRRIPNVRSTSCQPLRCMDGGYYPTCDYYGRPVAYVFSPCRGH